MNFVSALGHFQVQAGLDHYNFKLKNCFSLYGVKFEII